MASTGPASASKALDILTAKIESLTKASEQAVAAAKGSVLSGYQAALDSKVGAVHDIGLQLLAKGSVSSDYAAAVASVTAADVSKAVASLLKTAPTVVAAGALSDIPKYDAFAKKFS